MKQSGFNLLAPVSQVMKLVWRLKSLGLGLCLFMLCGRVEVDNRSTSSVQPEESHSMCHSCMSHGACRMNTYGIASQAHVPHNQNLAMSMPRQANVPPPTAGYQPSSGSRLMHACNFSLKRSR